MYSETWSVNTKFSTDDHGAGRVPDGHCSLLPTPIISIHRIISPQQAAEVSGGAWRPTEGQETLWGGALAGLLGTEQLEKPSQHGSLCVDALITSPTSPPRSRPPSGEALL